MSKHVVLMSIPGLRPADVPRMPHLSKLFSKGTQVPLTASFPAVTWPVQTNMLTGKSPAEHGVIANGFYWRESQQVEMWTAANDKIDAPQIWDQLHRHDPTFTSAAWFPMLSKQCGADYVCMPAPIHNPDGSESLWCYTKPTELYGELRDRFGHFPLQHFWGPLASIQATAWIADSAVLAARKYRPGFFYLYLPHLDYAAQRDGPDSPAALAALGELDETVARLDEGFSEAFAGEDLLWLSASEYVITPVNHVSYPNRALRDAGFLVVRPGPDGEQLDLANSRAWALADHQFSHVFVRESEPVTIRKIAAICAGMEGIAEVVLPEQRVQYGLNHSRAGELILISRPDSWQAYYWWLDDDQAPSFARTVDIHRKPGYDPVELHFDRATKSIPLDATLVRGSHGAPVLSDDQRGVLLASNADFVRQPLIDRDIAALVLRHFGAQ